MLKMVVVFKILFHLHSKQRIGGDAGRSLDHLGTGKQAIVSGAGADARLES
jgi:hypothetical protein